MIKVKNLTTKVKILMMTTLIIHLESHLMRRYSHSKRKRKRKRLKIERKTSNLRFGRKTVQLERVALERLERPTLNHHQLQLTLRFRRRLTLVRQLDLQFLLRDLRIKRTGTN
jgi:hypothetical protein